jgi:hypothetical protein
MLYSLVVLLSTIGFAAVVVFGVVVIVKK